MNAYFVRAVYGQLTESFRINKIAAIGWFDEEEISNASDWNVIAEMYRKKFPTDNTSRSGQNIGQIYRFYNDIKIGDIVLTTDIHGSILVGTVLSKPYFKNDNACEFKHRIDVDWKESLLNRKLLSIPAQNTIRSSLTVFKVSQVAEIAKLANIELPLSSELNYQKKISHEEGDIIEVIRQRLLELDDSEFEIFVSYIMQSLGFDATQKHGKSGDGGIDFEGVLDVLGIASVKLQIQVKRYSTAAIKETDIRNFRGALKKDHQGTFITLSDFNKKAIESASDPTKEPINLINGRKLIEIFIEQFDKVISLIKAEENQALFEKLSFRKIIIPN